MPLYCCRASVVAAPTVPLLDDITCERNASSAGDLEGLCRPEKDLLGGYVAQRRSIRRLRRLERILRVLPSGNSLLSRGVNTEELRESERERGRGMWEGERETEKRRDANSG